jgi:ATP-dependent exoDNAse (exonuclease V) alpha subunit/transposase
MTQVQALDILKTGANVFLTGEPGSGKTYTISQYRNYLSEHDIEYAMTASTGIAATHIGGITVHSWSGIGVRRTLTPYDLDAITSKEYVSKRISKTKVLIIDEISMLDATTLSLVDRVCKEVKNSNEAFGGMQVIFVGDFFQLPPIEKNSIQTEENIETNNNLFYSQEVPDFDEEEKPTVKYTSFAYDSEAWRNATPIICYLTEQHRQDDSELLSVLTSMRANNVTKEHKKILNKRLVKKEDMKSTTTKLFSHNMNVDAENLRELGRLNAQGKSYRMDSTGRDILVMTLKKGCLSPENLELKVGALVMFTKNNPKEGYANGTTGEVVSVTSPSGYPIVRTSEGRRIEVTPMDWNIEDNGKIKAKITQLPLRLAWAITVHKSQGMSLDSACIDLSRVFEYGQGYVALSRVRRLSGVHLLGINEKAWQVHPQVLAKDEEFRIASDQADDAFSVMQKEEKERMQDNFILACGGTLSKSGNKKTKNKKTDTLGETLEIWQQGKSIKEIAEIRGLAENTIFDHIDKLLRYGSIQKEELYRLVSPEIKKVIPEIQKAFKKLDTTRLTPVYEHFKEKYSYDDIKVAKMLMGE